jgi:hypothetical protein
MAVACRRTGLHAFGPLPFEGLHQAIQFRQAHPAVQRCFYDVYDQELTHDALGTVQRIYTILVCPGRR